MPEILKIFARSDFFCFMKLIFFFFFSVLILPSLTSKKKLLHFFNCWKKLKGVSLNQKLCIFQSIYQNTDIGGKKNEISWNDKFFWWRGGGCSRVKICGQKSWKSQETNSENFVTFCFMIYILTFKKFKGAGGSLQCQGTKMSGKSAKMVRNW